MKKVFALLACTVLSVSAAAGEIDLAKGRVRLPGNAFTIALTVTPEVQECGWKGTWGYVCGTGSGYYDGFRLRLRPTKYGCEPSIEIGKPKGEGSFTVIASGAEIPAGIARHLAATFDGKAVRLYVGGKCVVEAPYAGRYVQEDALHFLIGRAAFGLDYFPFRHNGARMWDEALCAEEIARLASGVETISDEAVAAFKKKPVDEVVTALISDSVERGFTAMAKQMIYKAFNNGRVANLPVKMLDEFIARAGTNDQHRVLDFKLQRARALSKEGRTDESLAIYAGVWNEAKASGAKYGYAAWAGKAYACALDRAGESEKAKSIRDEAKTFARAYFRGEFEDRATAVAEADTECNPQPGAEFFVSPKGNDAADGSWSHPFATFGRAKIAVRELKAKGPLPKGGVTVWVRGGVYQMKETLALDAADSGEEGAPVAWKAWGNERPTLEGGWRVPKFDLSPKEIAKRFPEAAKRIPAVARAHVVACDVRAAGYTHFEKRPEYGFYKGEVGGGRAMTDLYCNGSALELAREPNDGWLQTGQVPDESKNRVFRCDAGNLEKWTREPELMLTGYWNHHWADMTLHVSNTSFDVAANTITLGKKPFKLKEKRPYFFVNALCALDRPGEWYLDREAGILYVWPTESKSGRIAKLFKPDEYVMPDFDDPFVTLTGVKNLSIEGLVFQHGRGMAVNGRKCENVVFAGNVVRRFGTDGVWFLNSKNCKIRGNVLSDFGYGALRVSGGDRKTLTPSGISITDNDISFVERWKRTYAPGLHGDGCGTEVAHNHFHDMRSSAMRLEGNDWWVASNVVERVVTESDDQGGVDIFANPTYAGNVICYNVWRDIGCGGINVPCGQAGVRFDDAVSSMYVYCNYFENCSWGHFGAVQMNGGRNNTIDNNIFVACAKGVSIGGWSPERWKSYFERTGVKHWRTQAVNVFKPPYLDKYPHIAELQDMPLVNWLTRNVVVGDGILSAYPKTTVTFGNRAYDKMPSAEELAREPGFRPLPPQSELGARATRDLTHAKKNSK